MDTYLPPKDGSEIMTVAQDKVIFGFLAPQVMCKV